MLERSQTKIEPWAGLCPLCGAEVTNRSAAEHLGRKHGSVLCGVSRDGISLAGMQEIAAFIRRLENKEAAARAREEVRRV